MTNLSSDELTKLKGMYEDFTVYCKIEPTIIDSPLPDLVRTRYVKLMQKIEPNNWFWSSSGAKYGNIECIDDDGDATFYYENSWEPFDNCRFTIPAKFFVDTEKAFEELESKVSWLETEQKRKAEMSEKEKAIKLEKKERLHYEKLKEKYG